MAVTLYNLNSAATQKPDLCALKNIHFSVHYFSLSLIIFANICQDILYKMASQFGEKIRELRIKQNMLMRQLASKLDVDTSIISKIERGERNMKKEQIPLLAEILNIDKNELLILWLADQIIVITKDEEVALRALQVAEAEIKYRKL